MNVHSSENIFVKSVSFCLERLHRYDELKIYVSFGHPVLRRLLLCSQLHRLINNSTWRLVSSLRRAHCPTAWRPLSTAACVSYITAVETSEHAESGCGNTLDDNQLNRSGPHDVLSQLKYCQLLYIYMHEKSHLKTFALNEWPLMVVHGHQKWSNSIASVAQILNIRWVWGIFVNVKFKNSLKSANRISLGLL